MGMEFQARQATAAQADILGGYMQRPGKQPMRGLCRKRKGSGSRRSSALKYGRIFAGLHTGMLFVFCDGQPYGLAMLAHSHEEGRHRTKERSTLFICIPVYGVRLLQTGPFILFAEIKEYGISICCRLGVGRKQKSQKIL